jgi:hypothetical protein
MHNLCDSAVEQDRILRASVVDDIAKDVPIGIHLVTVYALMALDLVLFAKTAVVKVVDCQIGGVENGVVCVQGLAPSPLTDCNSA